MTLVPHFGRVARAQTLSLKNSPFLEAERVLGASPARMVLVHIVPNIARPAGRARLDGHPDRDHHRGRASRSSASACRRPSPSWGTLLNDGYAHLDQSAWTAVFAGLALTFATLGFTLFGEALRDAIDPKLKVEP